MNFNRVFFGGRLTAEPTLNQASNGNFVLNFTLAVNRQGRDAGADFIDCAFWGERSQKLAPAMHKGSDVFVEGMLRINKGANGKYYTSVMVTNLEFCGGKKSEDGNYNPNAYSTSAPPKPSISLEEAVHDAMEEITVDEDDLPF